MNRKHETGEGFVVSDLTKPDARGEKKAVSGEPKTLTHSVDIDLRGVTKLKSVTPEPSDQGVVNGETAIFRFRVKDGERITLDTGRRQFEVVVNPRAGGGYPVVARDEAAELRAAIREWSEANKACSQWVAGTAGSDEDEYPLARLSRAEKHLHSLAGGENEK